MHTDSSRTQLENGHILYWIRACLNFNESWINQSIRFFANEDWKGMSTTARTLVADNAYQRQAGLGLFHNFCDVQLLITVDPG